MAVPTGNTSTLCGLETNLIEQILVSKLYQCLLAEFQVCLYVVLEMKLQLSMWLPWWLSGKEPRSHGFNSWIGKIPWRRKWQPIPEFLPGEFHGQRTLAGYTPWGCKASDTIEQLTLTHQGICYSCLPRAHSSNPQLKVCSVGLLNPFLPKFLLPREI